MSRLQFISVRWLLIGVFLIFCQGATAQDSSKGLTVEITGLRNDKGKVLISLFNSANGFPGNASGAVIRGESRITNNSAHFHYENLGSGTYAIAVLHDENSNLKMDTNLFGLPKEGYGFSQNVMGAFGPPSFKKASFKIPDQKVINIRAKY